MLTLWSRRLGPLLRRPPVLALALFLTACPTGHPVGDCRNMPDDLDQPTVAAERHVLIEVMDGFSVPRSGTEELGREGDQARVVVVAEGQEAVRQFLVEVQSVV